jgi:hypothetical protein
MVTGNSRSIHGPHTHCSHRPFLPANCRLHDPNFLRPPYMPPHFWHYPYGRCHPARTHAPTSPSSLNCQLSIANQRRRPPLYRLHRRQSSLRHDVRPRAINRLGRHTSAPSQPRLRTTIVAYRREPPWLPLSRILLLSELQLQFVLLPAHLHLWRHRCSLYYDQQLN